MPLFALLGATALSMVGNMLTFVAIPWFVLQTTGSAAKMGLVGAAGTSAFVVASFLGGPIVDRLGFKRAGVIADLASGAAVAAIPLLYGTIGLAFWQLMILTFLGALLDAPGVTSRQSLVPDLARLAGTSMERANSALQAIQRIAQLVGPPLAGVLIVALGAGNVLWIDAGTFAVSALLVAVAVPSAARATGGAKPEAGYLFELLEGLRFIRGDRVIFSIVVIAMVWNFFDPAIWSVVLPFYADEVYGSALSFGVAFASFGGGALVGTVLYGTVGHRLPRRAALVFTFAVYGLPICALLASPPLYVTAVALALVGLGSGPINPLVFTLVQERTPERMLGRVFGALISIAMAVSPLGLITAGYVLDAIGLLPTLFGVCVCYAVLILCLFLTPALREMDEPERATRGEI